jgi:hypothetical protein
VFYEGEEMMLIEAMPAHDATGKAVPTKSEVTGQSVVTLTVEHARAAYAYPVVTGYAFEVGCAKVEAVIPPPPQSEAQELEEVVKGIQVEATESAPKPEAVSSEDGTSASHISNLTKNARRKMCSVAPSLHIFGGEIGGCEVWWRPSKCHFHYDFLEAWRKNSEVHPKCIEHESMTQLTQSLEYSDWIGPNQQLWGAERQTVYIYGDGYVSPIHTTNNICNPLSTC